MSLLTDARRRVSLVLLSLAAGFAVLALRTPEAAPGNETPREFSFHHDHVLGTSLDLWVTAQRNADAERAEEVVLEEIERLRTIFSTYDPKSEISRLNGTLEPFPVSSEMIEVLKGYEEWQRRSRGAFHGQLGGLVTLWKEAEKKGVEPTASELQSLVEMLRQRSWSIDEEKRTVTRLIDQPLNLNSLARGYIIQKAALAARTRIPSVQGMLLNLGGDMTAWGITEDDGARWPIAIQDPFRPEDNARPFARLELTNQAIATSGGYLRYVTIGGKRYSHLLDPRTGRPVDHIASSTVLAQDSATANALATTLCVVTPEEGLRLTAQTEGAECLIITRDGKQHRTPGFPAKEYPVLLQGAKDKNADTPWLADHQVQFTVTLPSVSSKRYRRPYVAIWAEDSTGKPVRSLTVWGNSPRYWKDLPQWWRFAKSDNNLVRAVTRATRGPGKYDIVWDGKDDQGNSLPQGTYTVHVEVHREHGKLVHQSGKITCGPQPSRITLEKNAETEETLVQYGPKKK